MCLGCHRSQRIFDDFDGILSKNALHGHISKEKLVSRNQNFGNKSKTQLVINKNKKPVRIFLFSIKPFFGFKLKGDAKGSTPGKTEFFEKKYKSKKRKSQILFPILFLF